MQYPITALRRTGAGLLTTATVALAALGLAGAAAAAPNPSHHPATTTRAGVVTNSPPPPGTRVPVPDGTGQLFLAPGGRDVWALSAGAGAATIINLATEKVVGTVTGLWGETNLAFDPSGRYAYLANSGTGEITQVDVATRSIVRQIPLGVPDDLLGALVVTSGPHGDVVYVTAGDANWIYVLDVAGAATSKITVADDPISVTLAGRYLVISSVSTAEIDVYDLATSKLYRTSNPSRSSSWAATEVNANSVAVAGFGYTIWLDPATRTFSRYVRVSDPGNIADVTTADNGRYTLTSVADFPMDPFPRNGTVEVIDNHGHVLQRIAAAGPNPWSLASGVGKLALIQTDNTGPTSVLITALDPILAPSTLRLSAGHGRPGTKITATVTGFNPTEKVLATLKSARPARLATATVAASTDVSFAFTVPKGTAPGTHTVTVTGTWSGLTRSVRLVVPAPDLHHSSVPADPSAGQHRHARGQVDGDRRRYPARHRP